MAHTHNSRLSGVIRDTIDLADCSSSTTFCTHYDHQEQYDHEETDAARNGSIRLPIANFSSGYQQQPGDLRHKTRTYGDGRCADYPVPSAVRNSIQDKYHDVEGGFGEFTNMRYTAITSDPNYCMINNGYNLRPRMYNRHTELLIGITYYNEDKRLFCRTTHSIMQNVRDIVNLKRSSFWHKNGPAWQKIVVCIVMDGIDPCDKQVLDVLATIGVYQDGVMQQFVNNKKTVAHLFEYTTQISFTSDQQLIRPMDDNALTIPPIQVILCLKTENSGKINSMRWIYNAVGRILHPEIVQHVDAGTRVRPRAILNTWNAFYHDKNLAGACGEIRPMLGRHSHVRLRSRSLGKFAGLARVPLQSILHVADLLLNPLIAAQNFEYKIASQLEQALALTTGYHSVLPGAFSAYRFRAIMGRPLEQYFHGDPTLETILGAKSAASSIYRLNMFLADDRVLHFELLTKAGSKWHTTIISDAVADTDTPENVVDFINQRRRWLNGSLAATVYSLRMSYRLFNTDHSWSRLFLLSIQMLNNFIACILAWFSMAGFLLTTFIVNDITGDPPEDSPVDGFPFGSITPTVNGVIQVIYLAVVGLQFVMALGSRPHGQVYIYVISFTIFAIIQAYLIINLCYLTKRLIDYKLDTNNSSGYAYISEYYSDIGSTTVLATAVSLFGVYIIAGVLCLDPWHLLHSWAQYLFISSSYTNILKTYAFSNIHDASWGHKSGKKVILITPSPSKCTERGAEIDRPEAAMEDMDSQFEAIVKRALTPFKLEPIQAQNNLEDIFMRFRVKLVAAYIFSNFFVCIVVLNDSIKPLAALGGSYWHKIWFFRIWMWGNSGLLGLQLLGCIWQRLMQLKIARKAARWLARYAP